MLTARRFSMAMSGAFVTCLAFAAHGSTNVFDDAVFWFRGGKDISGDHCMQQGEFFDDLHADTVSDDNHMMELSPYDDYVQSHPKYPEAANYKQNARFHSEQVVFPALGLEKGMQVLRFLNGRITISNLGFYWPQYVVPYRVFARENIVKEYTLVGRMRLDDDGIARQQYVFKIGYDSANQKGMCLGFSALQGTTKTKYIIGQRTPDADHSDTAFSFADLQIPTNTWFDIAVVVGDNRLRVGIAVPGTSATHGGNPAIAFAETSMWTDNCTLLDATCYRLFCRDGQTEPKQSSGADQTSFLGSVQQLAIWKRALTDQEVMAAFGMPRPAILRIGFDNGSSGEFGGTRSGSSQEIDGLGSWQNIANTMKTGDIWTVDFTALRDEASLPQIFSIKSLRGSPAQIEPKPNGTSLGEGRVGSSARFFWPVPADLINEGANTLVLERKDGWAGTFKLDAMELGGSLGVGTISGSSTDDGRTDPEYTKTGVPSAADPNPQHWPQELQPYSDSGITNLHLRVWVDPDVVDKASFTFKTTVQGVSSPGKTKTDKEYFTVFVNNRPIISCTTKVSASGLTWTRAFDAENLHGGWNDFEFICPEPYETCHWLFDYFRFEATLPSAFGFPPPPGMSVIVK